MISTLTNWCEGPCRPARLSARPVCQLVRPARIYRQAGPGLPGRDAALRRRCPEFAVADEGPCGGRLYPQQLPRRRLTPAPQAATGFDPCQPEQRSLQALAANGLIGRAPVQYAPYACEVSRPGADFAP